MRMSSPKMARRTVTFGMAAALLLCASPALAAPQRTDLSAEDIADLNRVSAYINGIETLSGKFIQTDQYGQGADGVFYMRRPGRARFEYRNPPDLPTIIADGTWLTVESKKMKTSTQYPLKSTPLSIVLQDKVDLASESRIVAVNRQPGVLSVTARDDTGVAQGEITLIFSDPGLELRNWVIKDAQGVYITMAVSDLKQGMKLDPALFVARMSTPSD